MRLVAKCNSPPYFCRLNIDDYNWPALQFVGPTFENGLQANTFYSASMTRQMHVFAAGYLLSVTIGRNARKQQAAHAVEHSNSGKKVSIRFDSPI